MTDENKKSNICIEEEEINKAIFNEEFYNVKTLIKVALLTPETWHWKQPHSPSGMSSS